MQGGQIAVQLAFAEACVGLQFVEGVAPFVQQAHQLDVPARHHRAVQRRRLAQPQRLLPVAGGQSLIVVLAELGDSEAGRVSVPLAVNADSLATWFLDPLARLSRTRPVVFELHRDDQDFTAGLLESGAVMAAVTSRADPVAGCRVVPLGVMRYEAVATPGFVAAWLPDGPFAPALERAPVVDFDRRDDLQTAWLAGRGVDPNLPPRHFVPASADYARAVRAGLGWGLLPRFQSADALARGELVELGGAAIDVRLYWQQWNLRSPLLDAIAAVIVDHARRLLDQPGA